MSENFIYRRSAKVRWIFILSLAMALIFDSIALSLQASPLLPVFSLLIVLYWAGHFLDRSYIATAFIIGLFNDALLQTPLGAHAIIFISLVYLLSRHRLHFRAFSIGQQAIFIVGYFYLYQLYIWIFLKPILIDNDALYFWLMPFIAAFCWSGLALLLNRLTLQTETN